jgi:aminoglycoside 6'-N-acetyltransferase
MRIVREITFQPLTREDFPMMTDWLAQPHVREFYQKSPVTLADVANEYGATMRGDEPGLSHIAFHEGRPFAYLQCYRNADYPDWGKLIGTVEGISIDLFIGEPAFMGKGYGHAMLRAYLQTAFAYFADESHAFVAHELANERAQRCSRAVGFQPLRRFFENGFELILMAKDRRSP